jgi:hypothetical protein
MLSTRTCIYPVRAEEALDGEMHPERMKGTCLNHQNIVAILGYTMGRKQI